MDALPGRGDVSCPVNQPCSPALLCPTKMVKTTGQWQGKIKVNSRLSNISNSGNLKLNNMTIQNNDMSIVMIMIINVEYTLFN